MSAIALFQQPSSDPVTIAGLIRAYTTDLDRREKTGDLSTDHVANCKRDLRNFAEFLGDTRLVQDCRQYDLTEWLRHNDKNWKSQHTKQRAISAVVGCFRWGADDEEGAMIDKNPYRFPKILKGKPAEPRRPALESEFKALMKGGSRPLRNALFFMWHTGVRTCEMREMTWNDVNLNNPDKSYVTLEKHKNRKKTGRARLIPMEPMVHRFMVWLKRQSKSRYCFTNCDGGQWNRHTWCKHFRRHCVRLGLDADDTAKNLTAYCVRHSFACEAIESGDTYERVADRLGNSAEVVRKIYASHTRQHIDYLCKTAKEDAERRKK
jgi:integrase